MECVWRVHGGGGGPGVSMQQSGHYSRKSPIVYAPPPLFVDPPTPTHLSAIQPYSATEPGARYSGDGLSPALLCCPTALQNIWPENGSV